MPRTNPWRSIQGEERLAERIGYERRRRGWSYETLAQHMAEAGCPINQSALHRVENGTPRRRITVDELLALAEVFDVTVDDLLQPVGAVANRDATELVVELNEAQSDLDATVARMVETIRKVHELPEVNGVPGVERFAAIFEGGVKTDSTVGANWSPELMNAVRAIPAAVIRDVRSGEHQATS